jgi:hypothetical protein
MWMSELRKKVEVINKFIHESINNISFVNGLETRKNYWKNIFGHHIEMKSLNLKNAITR